MSEPIDQRALDQIFNHARTAQAWQDRPVEEAVLRELYRLVSLGPTSANSSPARFVFVTSPQAKEKLAPLASSTNQAKILAAPVTAIIAQDTRFYEEMHRLFPIRPQMADLFRDTPGLSETTAARNSSMQAAYLIIAARALGLDTGPMSGFDNAAVDEAFFPDGRFKSNMICSLGYADRATSFPRLPRLPFEDAAQIL